MHLPPRLQQPVRALWQRFPAILLCIVCIAWCVRLTVGDRFPLIAIVFYAMPLSVIAALSIGSALIFFWRRRWRFGALGLAISVISTITCHATTYANNATANGKPGEKVVFWNVGRGMFGWNGVLNTIHGLDADIVGLVEAGKSNTAMEKLWREHFPGYHVLGPTSGMVLLSRGDAVVRDTGLLGQGGRYSHYEVQLESQAVDILIIDLKSDVFRSRRDAFEQLMKVVDSLSDRPLLVMGDFNTPLDSVFVAPLRARLTNAFHARGHGYDATWPIPFPVLSLDQVWASPRIVTQSCGIPWTWCSDHRPMVVTLKDAVP